MSASNSQFAMSAEIECLTAVPDDPRRTEAAAAQFIQTIGNLAPSLPGTSGIFNGYARIYCDLGHIELALIECDDPYLLTSILERVQILATRAVARLTAGGVRLVLANNNHSGLLTHGCQVWGDHENYLVEQHPATFTEEILPFLVTRIYQGAGGIHYPTGDYLAAVRPICMELASGGGTTGMRAVHSTAREEHHMGSSPDRFRYHQILADGHRSFYNLALQFGATALAIKAMLFDARLRRELKQWRTQFSGDWVETLQRLHVLAPAGRELRIDPLIVQTQRLYLEGARRYATRLKNPPAWIPRILCDWEDTLNAYARLDRAWLARRLDAFAKYELYSAVLRESGSSWRQLARDDRLFCELALLDQNYHEFCNPQSVFSKLEARGLVQHRVAQQVVPGEEAEPYVPHTATRARARARFIVAQSGHKGLVIDWSWLHD
jgi:hypothetical protein